MLLLLSRYSQVSGVILYFYLSSFYFTIKYHLFSNILRQLVWSLLYLFDYYSESLCRTFPLSLEHKMQSNFNKKNYYPQRIAYPFLNFISKYKNIFAFKFYCSEMLSCFHLRQPSFYLLKKISLLQCDL